MEGDRGREPGRIRAGGRREVGEKREVGGKREEAELDAGVMRGREAEEE